jgi:hypothetical protein
VKEEAEVTVNWQVRYCGQLEEVILGKSFDEAGLPFRSAAPGFRRKDVVVVVTLFDMCSRSRGFVDIWFVIHSRTSVGAFNTLSSSSCSPMETGTFDSENS